MKKVIIEGVEYVLYGTNESPRKSEPHMEIIATGEIPEGKQRGLLKQFLREHEIEYDEKANTHSLVRIVIKYLEE